MVECVLMAGGSLDETSHLDWNQISWRRFILAFSRLFKM